MDELDLLKKDWNTKENQNFPKLSYNDIYKMILKKSSSNVKWIFIISLLEFALWTIISLSSDFFKPDSMSRLKGTNSELVLHVLSAIGYIVLFYFFYLFFRNYKTISTTDNVKVLMENIIKTRRTVKQYVVFNLAFIVISSVVVFLVEFNQNEYFVNLTKEASADGSTLSLYTEITLTITLILIGFVAILLIFYALIYGILLSRLNKNYIDLKKIYD